MAIIPQNVYYGIKTKYLNKFKIDYQGTVATVSDLPEGDIPKGTVYNVEANGSNYLWNGEEWDELGATDSNLVHLAGSEVITGAKAFTNTISLKSTNDTLYNDVVYLAANRVAIGCIRFNGIAHSVPMLQIGYRGVSGDSWYKGPNLQLLMAGGFNITANDGLTSKIFSGSNDGTLAWDGQAIQTSSDERLKTPLSFVPDAVLDAWESINWGQFKFLDAVERKGKAARLHLGLIAQRVKAAFEAQGLDACQYGILCHEEREATDETPAVDLWMVRYEEALAMEAACQRRRADRAEARIKALENRLSALEANLS